ncbi:hypothetical protein V1264_011989 [Littorina saxatilis]
MSTRTRKSTHAHRTFGSSQKRLRVLVDMDQVLCDFEGSFLVKYREKYPEEPFIPLEERNTFYIADQYAKLEPDMQDKARDIWNAEGFFLNLPEIKGGCQALTEMSQMEDVDVFICTSPLTFYKYCLQEKFKWVEDHLGPDWISRLVITKDKTMVHGDVLIDDKPRIRGVRDPPSWKQVLFTAPYNQKVDLRGRQRLNTWTDDCWRDIIEDFKKRI